MITRDELDALVTLVESHPTARLLVDETYRELAYGDRSADGDDTVAPRARCLVDVEDVRPAGSPCRVADLQRRRS